EYQGHVFLRHTPQRRQPSPHGRCACLYRVSRCDGTDLLDNVPHQQVRHRLAIRQTLLAIPPHLVQGQTALKFREQPRLAPSGGPPQADHLAPAGGPPPASPPAPRHPAPPPAGCATPPAPAAAPQTDP